MVYDSIDNKTYELGYIMARVHDYNLGLEYCNYNHGVDMDLLVVPRTLREKSNHRGEVQVHREHHRE